jgi:hypothetical protein
VTQLAGGGGGSGSASPARDRGSATGGVSCQLPKRQGVRRAGGGARGRIAIPGGRGRELLRVRAPPYGRIRVRPGGFGRNDRLRLLCLVGTWDLPRRGVCSPARRSWPSHAAGSTLRPWVSRPEIIPVPRPSFVSSDFSLRAFTRSYLFCFP